MPDTARGMISSNIAPAIHSRQHEGGRTRAHVRLSGPGAESTLTLVSVDYGIDLDEVRRVVDGAEVLVIRFSVTDRRLLIDTRSNEHAGPVIKVVPPAKSAEERFRAIKMLRPRFRVPERVVTFHWPRHARALGESGVWDQIVRRIAGCGSGDAAAQCEEAYHQLLDEERRVEVNAVRGAEGFQTVWPVGTVADE